MCVRKLFAVYNAEEDQSLKIKLALRQPWVWSASDFVFLATAYEGGWSVISLIVSSSHWQSAVSVLIIAEWLVYNDTVKTKMISVTLLLYSFLGLELSEQTVAELYVQV